MRTRGMSSPPIGERRATISRCSGGSSRTAADLGGRIDVYEILSARLEPYNAEKDALRFTIRYTNNGSVAMNFWDSSFHLLVDGAPRAPITCLTSGFGGVNVGCNFDQKPGPGCGDYWHTLFLSGGELVDNNRERWISDESNEAGDGISRELVESSE